MFALACKRDLEGIVAKHKFGPYREDSAQWFKISPRKYSKWAGRERSSSNVSERSILPFQYGTVVPLRAKEGKRNQDAGL